LGERTAKVGLQALIPAVGAKATNSPERAQARSNRVLARFERQ
jgi:hypothetical protein